MREGQATEEVGRGRGRGWGG